MRKEYHVHKAEPSNRGCFSRDGSTACAQMWVTPLARPAALCCTIHRPRFEPHGRQIWLLELSLHFREKFKSNFGSIDLPHHESSPHLPAVLFQAFGIVQCQVRRMLLAAFCPALLQLEVAS